MMTLHILMAGANLAALFFLMYATAASSRPTKMKSRAIEFGFYFVMIAAFTALDVPAASFVVAHPESEHVGSVWPALRTLVSSVALARIGVVMLGHYGQKVALQKYIAEREPEKRGIIEDVQ